MHRGRRIALLAHCLLNVNARVDGLAVYAGVHPLVDALGQARFGVIQLPCPEMLAEGGHREPRPVESYDTPGFNTLCGDLAQQAAVLVCAHQAAGDRVEVCVGIEGSPSCGVSITNIGAGDEPWRAGQPTKRVEGCGVFVRALRERLVPLGVTFVAVDGRDGDLGVARVMRALCDVDVPDA